MILGTGIDLFDVRRMARELAEGGQQFAAGVFTPAEIHYCSGKGYPAQHYAARFAAKEAVLKAISPAGITGLHWLEIEVTSDADGRPGIVLHGGMKVAAESLDIDRIEVSLSHTGEIAVATAIVQSKGEGRQER